MTARSAARADDTFVKAAWVAVGVMVNSYSTGVNRPRPACRRRRWYVLLIHLTIAIRSSSRVFQTRRSKTLFRRTSLEGRLSYLGAHRLSPHAPEARGLRDRGHAIYSLVMLGKILPALAPLFAAVLAATCLVSPARATVGPGGASPSVDVPVASVLAVSIDGLNPAAIRRLGPAGAPTLHRLIDEGASTMDARTERESTSTLPNHTGMLTGRRVDADRGGHGVTWNDDRLEPRTVHTAAGERVRSAFSVVHDETRSTALFASKTKFTLFRRSWGSKIDRFRIWESNRRLMRLVRNDLDDRTRAFRFVHFSKPDVVGHDRRFMSDAYLDAVADVDRLLKQLVDAIESDPVLASGLVLVVTADHGGKGCNHTDPTRYANYRVPFLAWGPGVAAGADLYELNPDYATPGTSRTSYATTPPPIRNGTVANLATDLLGLGPVPGSDFNKTQDLDLN